eukprot:gene226-biopygen12080
MGCVACPLLKAVREKLDDSEYNSTPCRTPGRSRTCYCARVTVTAAPSDGPHAGVPHELVGEITGEQRLVDDTEQSVPHAAERGVPHAGEQRLAVERRVPYTGELRAVDDTERSVPHTGARLVAEVERGGPRAGEPQAEGCVPHAEGLVVEAERCTAGRWQGASHRPAVHLPAAPQLRRRTATTPAPLAARSSDVVTRPARVRDESAALSSSRGGGGATGGGGGGRHSPAAHKRCDALSERCARTQGAKILSKLRIPHLAPDHANPRSNSVDRIGGQPEASRRPPPPQPPQRTLRKVARSLWSLASAARPPSVPQDPRERSFAGANRSDADLSKAVLGHVRHSICEHQLAGARETALPGDPRDSFEGPGGAGQAPKAPAEPLRPAGGGAGDSHTHRIPRITGSGGVLDSARPTIYGWRLASAAETIYAPGDSNSVILSWKVPRRAGGPRRPGDGDGPCDPAGV